MNMLNPIFITIWAVAIFHNIVFTRMAHKCAMQVEFSFYLSKNRINYVVKSYKDKYGKDNLYICYLVSWYSLIFLVAILIISVIWRQIGGGVRP